MLHLFSLGALAFLLASAQSANAEAPRPSFGPADDRLQIEILRSPDVSERGSCGVPAFYSWFAGMLRHRPYARTTADYLKALSSAFSSEEAREAFRSTADDIALLVENNGGAIPYPEVSPHRPFCALSNAKNGQTKVEFSRPYQTSGLVFMERTVGGYGEGTQIDVLALKKNVTGQWRVFDVAVGSISD